MAEGKVEMLFLSPDFIGKGFGKMLLQFAIDVLKISNVDVNEQNTAAVEFYKKTGFITYQRSDTDDQGK